MIYMISYDLKAPTSNREKVETAIESLGAWCKYLTTTYLVSTNKDANTVQSICTAPLDNNDRMEICKTDKPIYGWLSEDQWKWISENL